MLKKMLSVLLLLAVLVHVTPLQSLLLTDQPAEQQDEQHMMADHAMTESDMHVMAMAEMDCCDPEQSADCQDCLPDMSCAEQCSSMLAVSLLLPNSQSFYQVFAIKNSQSFWLVSEIYSDPFSSIYKPPQIFA